MAGGGRRGLWAGIFAVLVVAIARWLQRKRRNFCLKSVGPPGATVATPRPPHAPAACADAFVFVRELGRGAFAVVWLAEQRGAGCEPRAVKLMEKPRDVHTYSKVKELMDNEVACHKLVKDAELFVRFYETFEDDRVLALVLEYLPGGELFEHICKVGSYTEFDAAACFHRVVRGVRYMHAQRVLHRDLKPENLLLAESVDNEHPLALVPVKICDFGLACLVGQPVKENLVGTPGFMAPEIFHGEANQAASDIYSLGVILFLMLMGVMPWDDEAIDSFGYCEQADGELLRSPSLQLDCWQALTLEAQDVTLRMLRRDPQARPSAEDLVSDSWLELFQRGTDSPSRAKSQKRLKGFVARRRLCKAGNVVRAATRLNLLSRGRTP